MTAKPMILFCDDEPFLNSAYIDELLLSDFDVTVQKDVDACLKFFREEAENVDLVILDIMMPPGRSLEKANTQNGRRVGFALYDSLRCKAPQIPIIILTNASSDDVENKFAGEARCLLLRKDQCLPFELVERVKTMLPHP